MSFTGDATASVAPAG